MNYLLGCSSYLTPGKPLVKPLFWGLLATLLYSCDIASLPAAGDADGNAVEEIIEISVPEVAVRRSKTLLTGLAPTAAETEAVIEDTDALKGLVTEWIETDEFEAKMLAFFTKTLQQTSLNQEDYAPQMSSKTVADRWRAPDDFMLALTESMARTALWIIDEEMPFSEIAAGRTWMMTTDMMAFLAAIESSGDSDGLTFYHDAVTVDGIDYDADTAHSVQIENKMIYSAQVLNGIGNGFDCRTDPILYNESFRDRLFSAFITPGNLLICRNDIKPTLFIDADATDWRPVTMVRGTPDDWWNVLAFRDATELTLQSSRTGFFSQPAFLATWRSNEDNDFRVTTNQSLIVGLGLAFEETDVSTALGDEGLSDEHAEEGTVCYLCHNTLDPMRGYFDVDFDPDFYGANATLTGPDYEPSFSFFGHTGEGSDLEDFGRHIAEHPSFASAWVNKMCAFANSADCDTESTEFQRIVSVFEDSDLNFKTMLIELFSSPLVTNTAYVDAAEEIEQETIPISLTRFDHLCPSLATRTGISDICDLDSIAVLAAGLPSDGWPRGDDRADQATDPGLFYRATIEALCSAVANELVDSDDSSVLSNDIDGSINWLVESLMGIPETDPRFGTIQGILEEHYDDSLNIDVDEFARMVSLTTMACVSPFIASTDF